MSSDYIKHCSPCFLLHPLENSQTTSKAKALTELMMESRLERLPFELIQAIAATSPLHAAAALSFTCKKLYYVLGKQYWVSIHQPGRKRSELATFIHHFIKELPGHRWCFSCSTVHAIAAPERAYEEEKSRPCLDARSPINFFTGMTTATGPHSMHFPQVQLIMDRNELGPAYGAPVESANFSSSASSENQHVRFCSRQARITKDSPPSLLLEEYVKIKIPWQDNTCDIYHSLPPFLCPHLRNCAAVGDDLEGPLDLHYTRYLDELECFLGTQEERADFWDTRFEGECFFCRTEFHIHCWMNQSSKQIRVSVTVYKNLGQCRLPQHPDWKNQTAQHLHDLKRFRPKSKNWPTFGRPHALRLAFINQSLEQGYSADTCSDRRA